MTHQAPIFPPEQQWPTLAQPICPSCGSESVGEVTWMGPATSLDTNEPVNLWECGACCTEWAIPVTHWPVLHGPDCPFCGSQITTWAALAPKHNGDLWLCEWGHEYVHTPDGLIVLPEEA